MLPENKVLTKITNEDDNIQLLSKGNGGMMMKMMKTKADFVTYLGGVSAQMLLHNFGTFTGSQEKFYDIMWTTLQ